MWIFRAEASRRLDGYDGTSLRGWGDGSFNGRGEHSPYGGGYIEYNYGPLLWIARMLKFKPLSAAEQEVGAMVIILKDGMFCMNTLADMCVILTSIFELMSDSQAGRDIVVNMGATKNTVHFERWLHYVREMYLLRKVKLTFVPTERMRADDKTKVVHKAKFLFCRHFQMNLPDI